MKAESIFNFKGVIFKIIFMVLYKLMMIRFTRELSLHLLRLLDYHRLIDLDSIYTEDYFSSSLDPMWLMNIELISETIYRTLNPKSVIDVSCGVGAYLYYLNKHSVEIEGIEGSNAAFKALIVPQNIVKKHTEALGDAGLLVESELELAQKSRMFAQR